MSQAIGRALPTGQVRPLRPIEGVICSVYICLVLSASGTCNSLPDPQLPLRFLGSSLVLFYRRNLGPETILESPQCMGRQQDGHDVLGLQAQFQVDIWRPKCTLMALSTCAHALRARSRLQAQGQAKPSWARPCLHVQRSDAVCQGGL